MDDNNFFIIATLIVILGILLFTGIAIFGSYSHDKIRIANFEKVIDNLSDEQKCLHICGFEFHNIFENYKFCIEKCDRISERINECSGEKWISK